MKQKTVYYLLAIAIVLIGYIVIFDNPYKEEAEYKSTVSQNLVSDFDSTAITRISIVQPEKPTVSLIREGDAWQVGAVIEDTDQPTYRAEAAQVNSLLENIKSLKKEQVASTSAVRHDVYGVTEDAGTQVSGTDSNGTISFDVIIGKTGPYYPSQYVRLAGADTVYLIKSDLTSMVGKEVKMWRDKSIVMIASDDIQSLAWQYPREKFSVEKADDGNWKTVTPVAADANTTVLQAMVAQLAPLSAFDFADTMTVQTAWLGAGAKTLVITKTDGSQISIFFGKSENGATYIKTDAEEYLYTIKDSVATSLLKTFAQIQAPTK